MARIRAEEAQQTSWWNYAKEMAKGFGWGAKGGASIVANTFTCGYSDKLGLTNSTSYQGRSFDISRASAQVASACLTNVVAGGMLKVLAVAGKMAAGATGLSSVLGAGAKIFQGCYAASKTLNIGARVVGGIGTVALRGAAIIGGRSEILGGVDNIVAGAMTAWNGDVTIGGLTLLTGLVQVYTGFTAIKAAIATPLGNCFEAGTQVVVGVNEDGSYITRNIEDIQVGDTVLSRDQYDEGDSVGQHTVTAVQQHTVDHLQLVTIADANGNIETIRCTDNHPFYVEGVGWVAAEDLREGQRLNEADDSDNAVVISSVREEHPEGITVYNFTVDGDHTYFVEDEGGAAVWVHNVCAGKNHWTQRALGNKLPYGHKALTPLSAAAHTDFHKALGKFLRSVTMADGRVLDMYARSGRSGKVIRSLYDVNDRMLALDQFFQQYKNGAHYNEFLDEMYEALKLGLLS